MDNHAAKEPLRKRKKKRLKKASLKNKNDSIEISSRLATFTMVAVLRNQGLHHQALAVLDELENKGVDKKRVKSEKQELLKIMEE